MQNQEVQWYIHSISSAKVGQLIMNNVNSLLAFLLHIFQIVIFFSYLTVHVFVKSCFLGWIIVHLTNWLYYNKAIIIIKLLFTVILSFVSVSMFSEENTAQLALMIKWHQKSFSIIYLFGFIFWCILILANHNYFYFLWMINLGQATFLGLI